MSDVNLTAILHGKGDLRLEDLPIPEPGPGEVQLSMRHVGICGADVRFLLDGYLGCFIVKEPVIMGHEASGAVSKLGEGVTSLKVGDRVAIEPGVPCSECRFCKKGRYNLCPDMKFCAAPARVTIQSGIPCTTCHFCKKGHYNQCADVKFYAAPTCHGNLARYYVHSADFCFKLPDHVSTEEGALLEPLSVAVHACNRAGVTQDSTILVCGAGPIGLLNLLTAKAMGASQVCFMDIDKSRLEFAKKLGADHTILVQSKDPKETAKQVEEALSDQPDITIECSGAPSSIQTAIYATRSGGCVVLIGIGPAEISLPIVDASLREVDIRGVYRYVNCYPTALEMVASGKVDVKPLITHRVKLEDTLDAFEIAKRREGIKIMISCAKE